MEWLSKPTRRLLLELLTGVVLYDLLLILLACVLLPVGGYPVKPVVLGLLLGGSGAALMLFHMAVITERVLSSQNDEYANKFTVAQSFLRKLVFVAVLFLCWRVLEIDLLAAVIGAMGMKAGAYLQPLIHRISSHKEERLNVDSEISD